MFWKGSLPRVHGVSPVAVSRYFALYAAQIGWLGLGAYLFTHAYWPSSCRPQGFLDIYACSMRLADQRGWIESALMTWLWSTPLLLCLEVSRRLSRDDRGRRS
ncbi:MAG: hypothetical protein ABIT16_04000 [Croceibacterium sp.]